MRKFMKFDRNFMECRDYMQRVTDRNVIYLIRCRADLQCKISLIFVEPQRLNMLRGSQRRGCLHGACL
jgi:hypothetical protein